MINNEDYLKLIGSKINQVEVLKIHDSGTKKPKFLVKCSCGFPFICDHKRLLIPKNACSYCIKKDSDFKPQQIRPVFNFQKEMDNQRNDLPIGKVVGRFTVLDYAGSRWRPLFVVRCTCGKVERRCYARVVDFNGCNACLLAEERQIRAGLPVIV